MSITWRLASMRLARATPYTLVWMPHITLVWMPHTHLFGYPHTHTCLDALHTLFWMTTHTCLDDHTHTCLDVTHIYLDTPQTLVCMTLKYLFGCPTHPCLDAPHTVFWIPHTYLFGCPIHTCFSILILMDVVSDKDLLCLPGTAALSLSLSYLWFILWHVVMSENKSIKNTYFHRVTFVMSVTHSNNTKGHAQECHTETTKLDRQLGRHVLTFSSVSGELVD